MKRRPFPEEGELVVGTVREVKGFGAFVTLDEYGGKEGFIHIAEVAPGWVKYVRDHVRENQKVVCKVLQVDPHRGHVDLSLKRVNDHQRREKISEWKNEQKAEKLFEIVCSRVGIPIERGYEEFGFDLSDKFGSLYRAFESAAMDEGALKSQGFEGNWVPTFVQVAKENIVIPLVTIQGVLTVESPNPQGVEDVRSALLSASKSEFEDVQIEVTYMGAPRYRIRVRAPDYKIAEEEMRKAVDRALETIQSRGGRGEFQRLEE